MSAQPLPALEGLVACPRCDALYRESPLSENMRARCPRCNTLIAAPRAGAMSRIVAFASASLILMVGGLLFPFLDLSLGAHTSHASILDVVLAFADGGTAFLSFAVAGLIVVIPAARLFAVLYVMAPLALGRPPARHATGVFRLSEALRPWAMAEVFILGVTVALVKVAGLATITIGPAFWAFVALVLIGVLQDNTMCSHTIWKTLEHRRVR
ncbi:MAG: paraquat-inducible protein A [Paracoccaceae bacterium]